MSLQHLTIAKFQHLAGIEFSDDFDANEKRVTVLAAFYGTSIDTQLAKPASKVVQEYADLIAEWNWLPELQPCAKFKAGGKWFVGAKYVNELTAGQVIELMSYNTKDERALVQSLHLVLASLTRECKYLRWAPEPYSGASHAARAAHLQKHATVGDVWGLISFFLLITTELSSSLAASSEKRLQAMTKKPNGKPM